MSRSSRRLISLCLFCAFMLGVIFLFVNNQDRIVTAIESALTGGNKDVVCETCPEYEKQIDNLQNQLEQLEQEKASLLIEIEDLKASKNNLIDGYEKLLAELQAELDAKDLLITELRAQISSLQQEMYDLHATINNLNEVIYSYELERHLMAVKDNALKLLSIPVTPLNEFTFSGNTLVKYNGNDTKVNIPSTYSLGPIEEVSEIYYDYFEFYDYIYSMYEFETFEPITIDLGLDTYFTITNMYELETYQDLLMGSEEFEVRYQVQSYVEGNEFVINRIDFGAIPDSVEYLVMPDTIIDIPFFGDNLNYIKLSNSLRSLSITGMFRGLNYLRLPASVTSISDLLFNDTSISVVEVDEANPYFTSQDEHGNELNCILTKDRTKLIYAAPSCDIYNLPSSITEYSSCSLSGIVADKVIIPSNVTKFGRCLFATWNTKHQAIELNSIPVSIHREAFKCCNKLTALRLDVQEVVPYSTFSHLVYNGDTTLMSKLTAIYVPYLLVDDYQSAEGWSDYADIIQASESLNW